MKKKKTFASWMEHYTRWFVAFFMHSNRFQSNGHRVLSLSVPSSLVQILWSHDKFTIQDMHNNQTQFARSFWKCLRAFNSKVFNQFLLKQSKRIYLHWVHTVGRSIVSAHFFIRYVTRQSFFPFELPMTTIRRKKRPLQLTLIGIAIILMTILIFQYVDYMVGTPSNQQRK